MVASGNNLILWNTVKGDFIEAEAVNISYIDSVDPNTGDMTIRLTNKYEGSTQNYIEHTVPEDALGGKLECVSGMLKFEGVLDDTNTSTILGKGQYITFNNNISGTVKGYVIPETIGKIEYDRYTCGVATAGYTICDLVKIEVGGGETQTISLEPITISNIAEITKITDPISILGNLTNNND